MSLSWALGPSWGSHRNLRGWRRAWKTREAVGVRVLPVQAAETLRVQQPWISGPGTSRGSPCWVWDGGTQGLAPSVCSRLPLPPRLCQRPGRHPPHGASDGCPCSMQGHWRSSHHSLCSSRHHLNPASDEAVIQQDVPSTQLLLQASQRAGDSPASGGSPQGAQTALPFPLGSPEAFMAPRVWSAAWPSEGRREAEVDLGWTTAATSGFAGHALQT